MTKRDKYIAVFSLSIIALLIFLEFFKERYDPLLMAVAGAIVVGMVLRATSTKFR